MGRIHLSFILEVVLIPLYACNFLSELLWLHFCWIPFILVLKASVALFNSKSVAVNLFKYNYFECEISIASVDSRLLGRNELSVPLQRVYFSVKCRPVKTRMGFLGLALISYAFFIWRSTIPLKPRSRFRITFHIAIISTLLCISGQAQLCIAQQIGN